MKVDVKDRTGTYLCSIDLPYNATLENLRNAFYLKQYYYAERQRFTLGSVKGPVLVDGLLLDQHVVDGSTLYFKDLGVQISWRLVFVLEYLGPCLIVPLFWFFPSIFYFESFSYNITHSKTQLAAVTLFVTHFIKRELETLFIHRFSNATMPVIRLPINCAHYWLICGVGIGYYLCHPLYQPPFNDNLIYIYTMSLLFCIFEGLNFKTHLILRELRPRGTKKRGIPHGWGFQWVSCANYTWEIGAWVSFSFLTMVLTSYFFLFVAFTQMLIWALKKHANYRKMNSNYPRHRKSMIPFII
ncbi:uncharacterized protein LOC128883850 isoform X2 [Hylaeus volcanicus]|uniref:uncharacterized protein LOC128883850 isoform X2 n=1 Tax=Hylaeus volcanicus TaxID=313075 RepID=UPI0023B82C43|nr:uncharacterized protein LOC128883850 isoform X2 [Hylaeus volcanicus]XP_053992639.1 uncharacterized protein LOC128883850 isoform X2 [Hylaeus volcanicus]